MEDAWKVAQFGLIIPSIEAKPGVSSWYTRLAFSLIPRAVPAW
jgi:hypothetical protein